MNPHTKACFGLFLIVVAATVSGCEQRDKRFAVAGQVTIDGKPVPKAMISFEPIAGSGNSNAITAIANGRFELKSEVGLGPGEYSVRITNEKPELEEFEEKRFAGKAPISAPIIPAKYAVQNALRVTIDGPKSDLLIQLKR